MRYLLTVFLCFLSTATAFADCAPQEKKIRFGVWSSFENKSRERAATLLAKEVNKEFQGRFCIEIITDRQKFKGALSATALQSGDIELAAPSFETLGTFAPEYNLFDLPFAFSNIRSVERFQAKRGGDFSVAMARNGLQPLAFWHGAFNQISARRPIFTPKDAAGLRFRRETGASFPAIIGVIYATSKTVLEKDVTLALKSDKITAQFTDWTGAQADGSANILDGITQTNHQFSGYQLMTSKAWWGSLDKQTKKSFIDVINRSARLSNFETMSKENASKRTLMRNNIPIRALTDKQRLKWKAAVQSVWDNDDYAARPDVQAAIRAANQKP